jgi:Hypoxia induced protein conserved region
MSSIIGILIVLATLSVAVILLLGLLNMSRSGPVNLSQKLMRWRVGAQFIAVCLIMASFYISKA